MKQVFQHLRTGAASVIDAPVPLVKPGTLLISTSRSIISAGTERMLQDFGSASWAGKIRRRPDAVKRALQSVRTDGLAATIETARDGLDRPVPVGYCSVGTVLEVGEGVSGFSAGDRVASNGHHAAVVRVPPNLCARVPATVSEDDAAFTVLAAVALHGIRLARPTLGETVVVSGLGVIGQLTVQLLRAHGCRVLAIDYDPGRVELARSFGAEGVDLSQGEDPVPAAVQFSRSRGADAVLITAASESNEPISQAARMCRKRGRIVLVGVTGLELPRSEFYEKELSFQVSCSYGPGRYDPLYEDKGQDYPMAYVRWTEQRNFEAVLDMMADGVLEPASLVSHRFSIDSAADAYELLRSGERQLGIVLDYPAPDQTAPSPNRVMLAQPISTRRKKTSERHEVVVGFIGAGSYASRVLIPAFRKAGAIMHSIATDGSIRGVHYGQRYGFREAVTDARLVLENPAINTVVVATRHDSHASYACAALKAGKHVFVEKPLALNLDELREIGDAFEYALEQEDPPVFMVGFNRRFAPHVTKMKELLEARPGPKAVVMTVNAGNVCGTHWTQDPEVGGGRIVGEVCHFVDLLQYLVGSPITGHHAASMRGNPGAASDTGTFTLRFEDGSLGTIHYFANGHRSLPKERLEVFCNGVLRLDDFRTLRGYGWSGFSHMKLRRPDKGHFQCVSNFVQSCRGGQAQPVDYRELMQATRVSIELQSKA